MKKFVSISAVVFSLMLVGAGCGAASSTGSATADAPEAAGSSVGPASVNAAFTAAGISFTSKDKTGGAKIILEGDADKLSSFTEYKFAGNSVILLVAEIKDASSKPKVADELSDVVKAQALSTKLDYSSVGGMKDPTLAAYILKGSSDDAASIKILSQISQ